MIPAALTDADLTTILDGCASERMELVARIRGKPGVCDQGITSGKEVLCKFAGYCQYQSSRVSSSSSPYLNGIPGIYAVCTREAAALAVAKAAEESGRLK